ncbi:MAG: heme ABC transporter ATP-binding protein [Bernardetiaceae bacterium]|nr:heme ABC transporter ATP-binding protein [Bernardetiaceae bacterium]
MLEVEQISYCIKGKSILSDISFELERGDFLAIIGTNGAGKSTLIKTLSQELRPSHGEVRWKNRSLSSWKPQDIALERAVMTQHVGLSQDFKVEEVVLMGRYPHFKHQPTSEDKDCVWRAMQKTQVEHLAQRNYYSLSGGERQRVQFARALTQMDSPQRGAKMLMLDEPLNNLDLKHQHYALQLAQDFVKEGNILLLVIHDINLAAMYADKILLLKNGRKLAFGDTAEVLSEQNLQRAYEFNLKVTAHPFVGCPAVHFYPT